VGVILTASEAQAELGQEISVPKLELGSEKKKIGKKQGKLMFFNGQGPRVRRQIFLLATDH
jgi:hypothetical protein